MVPETATFAEFAAMNRWKRSYVTQLKRDNRLILTEDGKAVRVAESLARIKQTADPSKAGVKARHAAARAAANGQAKPIPTPAPGVTSAAPGPEDEPGPEGEQLVDEGFQYWRRRSEKAKALAAERDNAVAEGKLMDAGEVVAVVGSASTALRVRLEALPDTLGPQLAAMTDENQVRATLTESIEHALEECARQFATLARQVTP